MGNYLAEGLGVTSQYKPESHQQGNIYNPEQLTELLQRQSQTYAQQQQLAQQLQAQAAGQGPNPAQEQYKLNVQHDIANAQGMIASQRGVNPALATRMGSNTAAAQTGEAAGRSATLQAQQQIAAQQALAGLYGQEQAGTLGAQQLYGQSNTAAMQANVQTSLANQQAAEGMVGGIFGAIGGAMGAAHGGEIPRRYAGGDEVSAPPGGGIMSAAGRDPNAPDTESSDMDKFNQMSKSGGPQSDLGKQLGGGDSSMPKVGGSGATALSQGLTSVGKGLGKGITMINSMGSGMMGGGGGGGMGNAAGAGEGIGDVAGMIAAKGGQVPKKVKNLKTGGHVGGKASVAGDDYKNDTVPALVSPGEIVLPRSVTKSQDPINNSAKFVAAILAKRKHSK